MKHLLKQQSGADALAARATGSSKQPVPSSDADGDFSLQSVNAFFIPGAGVLSAFGDPRDNSITASRDAAGNILVNGGAVGVLGGTPTVANTGLIQMFGRGGNDSLALDETNGALPRAFLFGGAGNDALTGGSGADQLFGQGDDDTLLGMGGADHLFGGEGDDVLTGGDGDDQMFGQGGNDRLVWNPGDDSDLAEGGSGTDTLEVNGANGDEVFTIAANGDRVRVDRVSPAPFFIDAGTIETIVLNGNGGNDQISASGNLAALVQLKIDGGAGNDTILGGNGDDLLVGGDGDDFIDGNQGTDTARLGAGHDLFQWDPGDGSDVVEGGDGTDTMLFNGGGQNEIFEASASGERALFTRDLGNIVMDLNDVERIDLNALGGKDTVVINDLGSTDVSDVRIDLAAAIGGNAGDGQEDTVIVNGTAGDDIVNVFAAGTAAEVSGLAAQVSLENFEAAIDRLVISGGAGDDVLIATGTVGVTLDGGDGDDVLIGGDGADILIGGDGDDILIGGAGNDVLDPGAGDNVVIQGFVAGAGTEDRIDLRSIAGATDFAWVQTHAQDVDGSAVLDLGNGAEMTLTDVSVAALHADDFLL